jgi:hypothetical protein
MRPKATHIAIPYVRAFLVGSVAEAGWPRLCLGWKPAAGSGSYLALGLGDSNVLVKEMLPLVSMDDMLLVKKDCDNLVPAFGTKTSAEWVSSSTYPGDWGAFKQFKTLRGQVIIQWWEFLCV